MHIIFSIKMKNDNNKTGDKNAIVSAHLGRLTPDDPVRRDEAGHVSTLDAWVAIELLYTPEFGICIYLEMFMELDLNAGGPCLCRCLQNDSEAVSMVFRMLTETMP